MRESFAGVALMAEAAAECGRAPEARAITQALETVAVITPSPLLEVNLLYATAELAPDDERERRYQDALAYDLTRWPWMRARVQLAYGQWLTDVGQSDAARPQLQAAGAVFERIGAQRWCRATARALECRDDTAD